MKTLYIFKLATAVSGQTHVRVIQEIRDAGRINLVGDYGKLSSTKEWIPAELMHAYVIDIKDDHRAALVEQANAAGRPSALGDHDIRSSDIAAWLSGQDITPMLGGGTGESPDPTVWQKVKSVFT